MTHSKFPWSTHPHLPSSVFDGDGKRIVDPWVPPEGEGWLPMETAPRDTTICDMWLVGGGRVTDLWWSDEDESWCGLATETFSHWMPAPVSGPAPSDAPAPTPLDPETAADNAALIAAIPQMVAVLEQIAKEDTLWASPSHYKMSEILGASDSGNVLVRGQYGKLAAAVLASIGRTL